MGKDGIEAHGLPELADLYERDIQREIGGRVIYPREEPNSEVQKIIDRAIERDYGKDALERIRRRVEEIRAEVKP